MKKNNLIYAFLLLSCSFFCACGDDTVYEAKKLSIEQIRSNHNFAWYDVEYNNYEYDKAVLSDIKDNFNAEEMKIVIFTAQSCLCGSKYTLFPKLIKVLDSVGIDENSYEIFVNRDETTNFIHPYTNIIEVKYIPDFYILKNGKNVFSIRENLDGILGKKIEQALMEGIWVAKQQ